MEVSIIDKELRMELYGVSGVAENQNWGETGFKLMNEMWPTVKAAGLKHKGINIWVYEDGNSMFAGVELEGSPETDTGLQTKSINLPRYAYYKHIGPYNGIYQACSKVRDELAGRGIKTGLPYIEIYGHWTEDETKLETELIWSLK